MKKYKCLFWDLDGTITDSLDGVRNGFIYAFKHYGIQLPMEEYKKFVGPPLRESFGLYFDNDKDIDNAISLYREYYLPRTTSENKLFDGIDNVLKTIRDYGYKMYIATSKGEEMALKVLNHFGIFDYFDRVFGADMRKGRVEKEQILDYAFKELSCDKTDCLMIGDTMYDVRGAEHIGIDCLACLYGYGDNEELLKSDIIGSVETPQDLVYFLCK